MIHDACLACTHHDGGGCRKTVCALVQWSLRGQGVNVVGRATVLVPEKRGG